MVERYLELLAAAGRRAAAARFGLRIPRAGRPLCGGGVGPSAAKGGLCRAESRGRLGLAAVADRALRGGGPAIGHVGHRQPVTWGGAGASGAGRKRSSRRWRSGRPGPADVADGACRDDSPSQAVPRRDTGPLHLAGAIGTPCVGLFGTTAAKKPARRGRAMSCCRLPMTMLTTASVLARTTGPCGGLRPHGDRRLPRDSRSRRHPTSCGRRCGRPAPARPSGEQQQPKHETRMLEQATSLPPRDKFSGNRSREGPRRTRWDEIQGRCVHRSRATSRTTL